MGRWSSRCDVANSALVPLAIAVVALTVIQDVTACTHDGIKLLLCRAINAPSDSIGQICGFWHMNRSDVVKATHDVHAHSHCLVLAHMTSHSISGISVLAKSRSVIRQLRLEKNT